MRSPDMKIPDVVAPAPEVAPPAERAVRFLVHDAPFEQGAVVEFPLATAERLVRAGTAEYVS